MNDFINELNKAIGISTTNKISKEAEKTIKTKVIKAEKDYLLDIIEKKEFEKLKRKDLLDYFILQAKKNNVRYVVTNIQKELRPFKILLEKGVTKEEIINMIDFIFNSPQNYINKEEATPLILYSTWFHKILEDSKAWKEGKYNPHKKKKVVREWKKDKSNKDNIDVVIGEW